MFLTSFSARNEKQQQIFDVNIHVIPFGVYTRQKF